MDGEMAWSGWEGRGGVKGTERHEGLEGEGRDKWYRELRTTGRSGGDRVQKAGRVGWGKRLQRADGGE